MEKKKDSKSPVRDDTDSRGNDLIAGRNAVSEALRAGRSIDRLYVQRGEKNGSLLTLIAKAKAAGAAVKETDSRKLDQLLSLIHI